MADPPATDGELELDLDKPAPAPSRPPRPPAPKFKAILPPSPEVSGVAVGLRVALAAVLIGGAVGGYYYYCSYEVGQKHHAFVQATGDLQQMLMRPMKRIGPDDIKRVVVAIAAQTGVIVNPAAIDVRIMRGQPAPAAAVPLPALAPASPRNVEAIRRRVEAAMAARHAAVGTGPPRWSVGFSTTIVVKHGFVERVEKVHRFTSLEASWIAASAR